MSDFERVATGMVQDFRENVAWNRGCTQDKEGTVSTTVNGWIGSPGHKRNLLSDTIECGIAVVNKGDQYWYTQLFATCDYF